MVTLYYLRRFINFWNSKFSSVNISKVVVSEELAALFESVFTILKDNILLIEKDSQIQIVS